MTMGAELRKEPEPSPAVPQKSPGKRDLRSEGETIDFSQGEPRKRKWAWMLVAAGMLLIASVLLWGYPGF